MDEFDVVVIGGGSTGENIAGRAAAGGLRVALVEADLVGGECSYWACMPSKALLRPGEALHTIRRVPGAGEAVTGPIDVEAALARRDKIAANWNDQGQADWVADAGIELVRGHGRLAGERAVEVETRDGSRRRLTAATAVAVATGSHAAVPPIQGLDKVGAWTSREGTSAKQVPRRLIVLGGGPVGCELAQAWHRLGAEEVTLVQRSDRLLPKEEPFAGDELREEFTDEGITVICSSTEEACGRDDPDSPVTVSLTNGRDITADELLVATGRRAASDDLGLETVGLEPGSFIDVDDQLRATGVAGNWLYAAGDANGRALLTHMGKYQARIVGDVILGEPATAWAPVPRVAFTDPQVAAVGLTEAQARAAGVNISVGRVDLSSVAAAALFGRGAKGTCQIVVDSDRRVIIGATFTGPEVGELLHAATIAIAGRLTLDTLWHAVPSYPTLSEVWLRLLESCGL